MKLCFEIRENISSLEIWGINVLILFFGIFNMIGMTALCSRYIFFKDTFEIWILHTAAISRKENISYILMKMWISGWWSTRKKKKKLAKIAFANSPNYFSQVAKLLWSTRQKIIRQIILVKSPNSFGQLAKNNNSDYK